MCFVYYCNGEMSIVKLVFVFTLCKAFLRSEKQFCKHISVSICLEVPRKLD